MASSKEHYETVLSSVYSWMLGGFPAAVERNVAFFKELGVKAPSLSGLAVDLGAGCGFQSIPLAQAGYEVFAIDLDRQLLDEMNAHSGGLTIHAIQDDLLRFSEHLPSEAELAVCMTDTLLHLESAEDVSRLISGIFHALEIGGRLILTFRDLTRELDGLDRFIPVRSDSETIFTCFLEYEPLTVKVHDLVYRKVNGRWEFRKSFYRKLRLSERWVVEQATKAGFAEVTSACTNGVVTIVATRQA